MRGASVDEAVASRLLSRVSSPIADTTYLRVEGRWSYLATVMDLFSRRILGWSVRQHNDSKLVCQALRAAVLTRGGETPKGLIHHSDRGSTYASYDYTDLLSSFAIRQSMSAKGNCYDNAAQESFYGRYKTSSVRGHIFASEQEARSHPLSISKSSTIALESTHHWATKVQ